MGASHQGLIRHGGGLDVTRDIDAGSYSNAAEGHVIEDRDERFSGAHTDVDIGNTRSRVNEPEFAGSRGHRTLVEIAPELELLASVRVDDSDRRDRRIGPQGKDIERRIGKTC